MQPKLFEYTICTQTVIPVTLCTPTSSLLLTWNEKYGITWKNLIVPLLNALKIIYKLKFTTRNYTSNYNLHPKPWMFIHVNNKLNVRVQSVIRVVVYSAKYKKGYSLWCKICIWKVYDVIRGIV